MLEMIYSAFLILGVVSLALYKCPKTALWVGFGLPSLVSLYSVVIFITNINLTYGFKLAGNFIFSPEFILTPLSGFFSFLVVFISFGVGIYTIGYAKSLKNRANLAVFASLFNFFILSMLLVLSSSNVFSFIVLWEVMTLISALLLKFNDEETSNKTVMIYLGVAQIGAFCIMIALLLISGVAGSMEFAQWQGFEISSTLSICILTLLLIGFGSKAGMFPFHVWSPLAYPLAPSNVAALMSGVMSKMAIFGLIKFSLFLPINPGFGLSIMVLGALSALIGISYALVQKEYSKLIAYSSVENIGIILLGVGTGFYGIGLGEGTLALLGFVGALFHALNHATFKSLLFLGAGNIYNATQTKEIDKLGGLARKMPITAILFLIGVVSISALPPLNGFVSEWFIYRSMILGGLSESLLGRAVFALSIVALALTGAIVVFAFIKLYALIFAGVCKDEKIYNGAYEKSLFMPLGMFVLAFSCLYFGLGANNIIMFLGSVVMDLIPNATYSINIDVLSMPIIALLLCFLLILPFLLFGIFKANMSKARLSEPWACGFKFNSRMQTNSNAFVGDFKRIISKIIKFKEIKSQDSYFAKMNYESRSDDFWWNLLYAPVVRLNLYLGDKIGCMQNGKSSFYVIYILIYLYAMMIAGFYFLGE
ncbi:hydrogenase-4, component B [Campylobacter iguaniorum]|uniref:proton-conducting transporter transmembrane domain-containing protein n=1 Tax=Campylobacter iguaniorum TaxID=1244531 RepID=UPI00073A3733|nr:proton-conducting transporter membrane subunit [Campylobacter iguaniorum]ALV23761.1 hydrogenase-4, component B [Campylobacter iguaniorum]